MDLIPLSDISLSDNQCKYYLLFSYFLIIQMQGHNTASIFIKKLNGLHSSPVMAVNQCFKGILYFGVEGVGSFGEIKLGCAEQSRTEAYRDKVSSFSSGTRALLLSNDITHASTVEVCQFNPLRFFVFGTIITDTT